MKTMSVVGSVGFILLMVGCGGADPSGTSSEEDELKSATVLTCTPVDADEACLESGKSDDYCIDQLTITVAAVNKAKLRIDRSFNFQQDDDSNGPPPGAVGLPILPPTSSGPPAGAVGLPLPAPSSNGPPPGTMGMPLPGPQPITTTGSLRIENGRADGAWNNGFTTLSVQKQGRNYVGSFKANKKLSFVVSCAVSGGSGGPPPGAVGLPLPQADAGHNGPPPGAVGLPLPGTFCPTQKTINCMPPTENDDCVPANRGFIEANCPNVSFLD